MGGVESATGRAAARRESRGLAVFECVLAVVLAAGDYFELVPFSSTPFYLLLGWLSLRWRGLGWRDLGFRRPPDWPRALALGTLAGVAMELFATFVTTPWLSRLAGRPPDLADFRVIVGNPRMLLLFLALSWTLAAFGEELSFRGYVMNRFADLAGPRRGALAWGFALVASSVLFGWGHGGQGITGMVQETLSGGLLAGLYLAAGRNLTVPIVAHGVSNTVAFLFIYFDRYPGV